LIRHLDDLSDSLRRGAVTIGNFDGVHRGHARIIERLVAHARQVEGPAIAFTLEPHPARILRPAAAPPALTWIERKAELLGAIGVDVVIAYPTDRAFLNLEAKEFFDRILLERLDAQAIVEGPNFFFGHNRSGNVDLLARFCKQAGVTLEVVEPCVEKQRVISSSRIRQAIAEGKLAEAGRMLTQPYRLRGRVVRGDGRGADLGFPTANLGEVNVLLPGEGVYAGRAFAEDRVWSAAISIGPNWTFDDNKHKVEAFLVEYDGSLYGHTIEVDFIERLRDIERFASVRDLTAALQRDVETTQAIVAQYEKIQGVAP
jgi:riboflavin kinase/FMN adenylyltransferase